MLHKPAVLRIADGAERRGRHVFVEQPINIFDHVNQIALAGAAAAGVPNESHVELVALQWIGPRRAGVGVGGRERADGVHAQGVDVIASVTVEFEVATLANNDRDELSRADGQAVKRNLVLPAAAARFIHDEGERPGLRVHVRAEVVGAQRQAVLSQRQIAAIGVVQLNRQRAAALEIRAKAFGARIGADIFRIIAVLLGFVLPVGNERAMLVRHHLGDERLRLIAVVATIAIAYPHGVDPAIRLLRRCERNRVDRQHQRLLFDRRLRTVRRQSVEHVLVDVLQVVEHLLTEIRGFARVRRPVAAVDEVAVAVERVVDVAEVELRAAFRQPVAASSRQLVAGVVHRQQLAAVVPLDRIVSLCG